MQLTIVDFRTNNDWRWESLSFALPPCIKEEIRAILVQEYGIGEDVLMWKFMKDGNFSTNSTYLSIKAEVGVDTIPKIMSYLWLCMHNSVPVREVLEVKGNNCNPLSPICRQQGETINHLLRECLFARQFWFKIRSPPPMHNQSLGD